MTYEQLISTYNLFSDEELMGVYRNIGDYSEDAKKALSVIIEDRGGIEGLLAKEQVKLTEAAETERIRQEVKKMSTQQVELDFLNKMIVSEIFDANRTQSIIRETFEEINRDLEDRKIKPRTIIGGIAGAGISALAGGVFWGLQMMWSGRIFVIFLIGLILLCYGMVRIVTRQSYKNQAVLILTVIAVLIALVIGQLMFEIFGRQ